LLNKRRFRASQRVGTLSVITLGKAQRHQTNTLSSKPYNHSNMFNIHACPQQHIFALSSRAEKDPQHPHFRPMSTETNSAPHFKANEQS
jgi:hypothetical protein